MGEFGALEQTLSFFDAVSSRMTLSPGDRMGSACLSTRPALLENRRREVLEADGLRDLHVRRFIEHR